MKKIIYSLTIASLLLSVSACKKGENDPFMSLHTRKARVAGEWKLSAMEETSTDASGGLSVTTTTTYNGTTETRTTLLGSSTDNYTVEFTFEKDGSFTSVYTNTSVSPAYVETTKGNWAFLGKSKTGELKNKEAITLSETSVTDSEGENLTIDGTFGGFSVLIIDQLKNKEIIFKYDEANTYTSGGSSGNSYSRKGSMTLTKK